MLGMVDVTRHGGRDMHTQYVFHDGLMTFPDSNRSRSISSLDLSRPIDLSPDLSLSTYLDLDLDLDHSLSTDAAFDTVIGDGHHYQQLCFVFRSRYAYHQNDFLFDTEGGGVDREAPAGFIGYWWNSSNAKTVCNWWVVTWLIVWPNDSIWHHSSQSLHTIVPTDQLGIVIHNFR